MSAGDARRLKCAQKSITFGLNEASVLHNHSCGLVVDGALGEWQGRRE